MVILIRRRLAYSLHILGVDRIQNMNHTSINVYSELIVANVIQINTDQPL